MEIKQPKSLDIKEWETSKFQDNVREFCNQFKGIPFLTGAILNGGAFSITTSGITIDHKLQRTPVGFILIDKDANADVWRTAWDDTTISLDASGTANIKVWVF